MISELQAALDRLWRENWIGPELDPYTDDILLIVEAARLVANGIETEIWVHHVNCYMNGRDLNGTYRTHMTSQGGFCNDSCGWQARTIIDPFPVDAALTPPGDDE